jgi:hypothetical protein
MRKSVDQKLAGDAPATKSIDQAMELGMGKIGDATEVTLLGDPTVFMPGFGTSDPDFFFGLLHQVCNAGKKGRYPDEKGIKFMLAFIRRIEPRDEIEAALIAQMAATFKQQFLFAPLDPRCRLFRLPPVIICVGHGHPLDPEIHRRKNANPGVRFQLPT